MNAKEFNRKVVAHWREMWTIAARILRDQQDASDAVQDAMERLWKARDALPDDSQLGPYLSVAARNAAVSRLRSRRETLSMLDAPDPPSEGDASDQAQFHNSSEILDKALSTLPVNQAKVLRLSIISALSNEEIVQATGLTNENVRTLLSRGRKQLRETFQKLYNHGN
ncbi:MAG: sigma-70 family RNA polymerase sigma factor [Bacteroidales bacterium]|nr:sigma-70 family RNA polymerase sigma factor [Bacteroidales bacterium]MCD8393273.1 sigma-70 family RNA polymerase sigma factor [Bacteroidales bacterium]